MPSPHPTSPCQKHHHKLPAGRTHITILQGLVFLRYFQKDLLECGIHQPKTGEVQLLQALLQVLWKGK